MKIPSLFPSLPSPSLEVPGKAYPDPVSASVPRKGSVPGRGPFPGRGSVPERGSWKVGLGEVACGCLYG